MTIDTWTLRTNIEERDTVEAWLEKEAEHVFVVFTNKNEVNVDFKDIGDAFKFRMRFDEILI